MAEEEVNELTHLDLFSGIGGFSLGFEAAGFRTIAFCEIDPDADLVLGDHWPDVPNLGDITKLCRRIGDCLPEDEEGYVHCPRCNTEFGDCDCIGTDEFTDTFGFPYVITGGVPCQPASSLGLMRGAADERWLWPEAVRVVGELRPRFAVFENPPSLLVLPEFVGVIGAFADLGYDLWWDVIPAAALGAGHLRERVILVFADTEHTGPHPAPKLRGQCQKMGRHQHARQHGGNRKIVTHTHHPGLEGHGGHGVGNGSWSSERRPASAPDLRGRVSCERWWHEAHTGIPVMVHGLSARLVEAAVRCSGNAIVPQLAQVIAETLLNA